MINNGKFRIAVVDDDQDILDLVKLTLEPAFEVVAIRDPSQALDFMDIVQPDLAVLDIMMPKVTGYHLLEEIRKTDWGRHTQIIFLSAKSATYDIRYGYKLGANYYLPKPFQTDRLRRTVEIVLSEGVLTHPREKLWSVRDVEIRMSLKMPTAYTDWETALPLHRSDSSMHRSLRRPLSNHKNNDDDDGKWFG